MRAPLAVQAELESAMGQCQGGRAFVRTSGAGVRHFRRFTFAAQKPTEMPRFTIEQNDLARSSHLGNT